MVNMIFKVHLLVLEKNLFSLDPDNMELKIDEQNT
jgi:hypothetical protein